MDLSQYLSTFRSQEIPVVELPGSDGVCILAGSPMLPLGSMEDALWGPTPAGPSMEEIVERLLTRVDRERVVEVDFTADEERPLETIDHTDASVTMILRGLVLGNPRVVRLILRDVYRIKEGTAAMQALRECLAHPECRLEHLELSLPAKSSELIQIAKVMETHASLTTPPSVALEGSLQPFAPKGLWATLRCLKVVRCGITYRRLTRASEPVPVFPPDEGLDGAALRAFGRAIAANPRYNLEEIAFSRFSTEQVVTEEDLRVFAEALRRVHGLRKMTLSNLGISRAGMAHLSALLRDDVLPALAELELSNNMEIGAEGLVELFGALHARRRPLVRLDLKSTVFPRHPVEAPDLDAQCYGPWQDLLASPEACPQELNLSDNRLPPGCIQALIRGVASSSRLEKLQLAYTKLSDDELRGLGGALRGNPTLTSLDMGDVGNRTEAVDAFLAGIVGLQHLCLTVCRPEQFGAVHLTKNTEIAEAFLAGRYPIDELEISVNHELQQRLQEKTRETRERRVRMAQALRDAMDPETVPSALIACLATLM